MELGHVVEKNLTSKAVLITLIVLAALFHVVCFILLVILMLTVYARSLKGPVPFMPKHDEKETGSIILGLSLLGIGLYFLLRTYIPDLGWQIAFLIVGSFLIAFGISRRSEISESEA